MLLLDANVLIVAFRADLNEHRQVGVWLDRLIASGEPFGFPEGILMGFVRIVTQKPFDPITPIHDALLFADKLRSVPSCRVIAADTHQWETFVNTCRKVMAHGKKAQDVYWASFALSHDVEWITFDGGFRSVPGLRWRSPFDQAARANPL